MLAIPRSPWILVLVDRDKFLGSIVFHVHTQASVLLDFCRQAIIMMMMVMMMMMMMMMMICCSISKRYARLDSAGV